MRSQGQGAQRVAAGSGASHGASCRKLVLLSSHVSLAAPSSPLAGFDLLRVPLLGRFLKWRHARLAVQMPMVALAGVLIFDGLRGPQVGAMNLAGVLPWIHWRGLLILGLLAAGNFFCMACPFLLPRTLARRWLPTGRDWPRWLRSKWLAVVLLVLFLWAYEAFSLWDSPWWTAWLALGYFVGGLCHRRLLPRRRLLQIRLPDRPVQLRAIAGFAAGSEGPRSGGLRDVPDQGLHPRPTTAIPGCELHLFQPRKTGNMDCTFCLDCVHACPHDNVGILARPPGSDSGTTRLASRARPIGKRPDLAVLIVVLVFGAFVNAAGMVAPVLAWRDRLESLVGQPRRCWQPACFTSSACSCCRSRPSAARPF